MNLTNNFEKKIIAVKYKIIFHTIKYNKIARKITL